MSRSDGIQVGVWKARVDKKHAELEKCSQELEEKAKLVRSQKSEIKQLRESEAEIPMLTEALTEQRRITRDREAEAKKLKGDLQDLTGDLQDRDAELETLRKNTKEQEDIIRKFREEEQKREEGALCLKRKRQEEEDDRKRQEKQMKANRPPGALNVPYDLGDNVNAPVMEGLLRLQQNGLLCDAVLVASGDYRFAVHRAVLAAASSSAAIIERLRLPSATEPVATHAVEIDLSSASHEAVDLVVKWLYADFGASTYQPATAAVNEEVLALASELSLPKLCELCCSHFARSVTVSNFVPRVRLCEQYGLPTFRASLIGTLLKDVDALQTVSQDPATLEHPALMRELLSAVAMATLARDAVARVDAEARSGEVEVRSGAACAEPASKGDVEAREVTIKHAKREEVEASGRNALRHAKKGA